MAQEKVTFQNIDGVKWTPKDLQEKFGNSCFMLSYDDPYTKLKTTSVCMVEKFSENGETFVLNVKDKSIGLSLSNVEIINERPIPCITNHGSNAFIFNYNPDRQWKRGVAAGNSFVAYSPYPGRLSRVHNYGNDLLVAIFTPDHCKSLKDAILDMKVNPKCTGRAINNLYWIMRKDKDSDILLYRRKAYMGAFLGKRFFISESAGIFKEELKEDLPSLKRDWGYA